MTDAPLQSLQVQSGFTPGAQLRHAREAAGMALPVVSTALHLTVHYIKALENDEYNKLPALIFVKGYIRAYARFLKLDVDALLASYDRYVQTLPEVKSHTLAGNYTRKRSDQAILWAIAATLVVLVGIGLGWWFFGGEAEPARAVVTQYAIVQPTPAAASNETAATENSTADAATASESRATTETTPDSAQTPSVAATASVPAVTGSETPTTAGATVTASPTGGRQINVVRDGSDQLQINFAGNSWVEITDSASTRLYADMLHSGDNLLVKGRAPFQVLLGDARNVKVSFNAAVVDIAGSVRSDSTARLTLADKTGAAGVAR